MISRLKARLYVAAATMAGSSLLVTLNALRLVRP